MWGMKEEQADGGLRDLLSDAIDEAKAVILDFRGVKAPEGDDGHVWRWAFMYVVLAHDFGGYVSQCSAWSVDRRGSSDRNGLPALQGPRSPSRPRRLPPNHAREHASCSASRETGHL